MQRELFLALALLIILCHGDIQVSIDEELSVGTEVTRVPSHRSVFGNLSEEQIQGLTYAILSQNTPPASFFRIDPKTGVVTVASRMDRESICDPTEICSVTINIAIQSGTQAQVSFSTVISLDVIINDINDNPPRFPAHELTLDIPEGAKVGTELKISGAVDRDSKPEFTVQHYNITPAMTTFSLRPTINPDGSSTINLRLEKELDRETTDHYLFNIMAYDGGANPQSDYLSVTVRVTDDNDNVPVFSQSKYEMTVNTNEKIGGKIGQVMATDADAGEFGRITYSFSPSSESAIKGVFAVNSSTGWITLSGDIRSIRRSSPFFMYVDARDHGEPPLSSQSLVSLVIINSENNAPYVKVNTVAAADVSTLSIPESAGPDYFVAFVDVDDKDDGDNGKVTCQIITGVEFKLSPIPNKGYTLLLNTEVDREKRDSYTIRISCKDSGTPSLETQVTLTVNITDINDNTPMFTNNLYTTAVDENRDPGQFILQVIAHDADVGLNAEITYSLPKEAQEYIKINQRTGVISTSASLDREQNPELRFKVFATDSGEIPRTGVAEISIIVKDVNDNNPQFNKTKFVFSVSELAPNNTIVGNLDAYDLDAGPNGQIDFFFGGTTTGEVPLPFSVLLNGSVLVTSSLDRETKGYYSFTAIVKDRGDIPRSSSVSVEVKVVDENDNDPVILFPTSRNHTIIISSLPENGMVLGRIIAYDMDEGEGADLRYFLYEGNDDGAFSMGLTSGELMIQNVRLLQNSKEYFLSIKVEDSSTRPRNTTTQLRIEVMFDNRTAAMLQESGNTSDQYIIIVGVIGGATIALSIIIISVIFIILRSEKNRRGTTNAPSVKNKFFDVATSQMSQNPKCVENLDTDKFQNSSSLGGEAQDGIPGSRGIAKKQDDVPKKVSFSLQEDPHDQSHCQLTEKHLRLNLSSAGDSHMKIFSNPDDISSDTSCESGTCDSGRGTSEEDIKFDYPINKGTSRTSEPFQARDRSIDQFPPSSHHSHPRSNPSFQGPGSAQHQTPAPPINPGHARYQETGSRRQEASHTRSSYQAPRHPLPVASFTPNMSSSMRQTSHQRGYNVNHQNCENHHVLRPMSAMAYKKQNSNTSIDDDVSTTTSGSYVINSEDVLLDSFTSEDIIV